MVTKKNSEFLLIARLQKLRDKGCSLFLFYAGEIGLAEFCKAGTNICSASKSGFFT